MNLIQNAVRALHKIQDALAATPIEYTQSGTTYKVVARLGVVSGESTSYEGVTTEVLERIFKVTRSTLPITPERGDRIKLPIYGASGSVVDHEMYVVSSDIGLDVAAPQGNHGDAWRIQAKRIG